MTDTPDSDDDVVFRDLIALALLGFVTIVVLLLPHIHPPTEGEDAAKPAGNIIIEARWPDDVPVDVDLWVRAPNERPVGYSAKHSATFDLLRDDLGSDQDDTGLNYEFAYSRGAPAGEYAVNIHWYSNVIGAQSVSVSVVVSMASADGGKPIKIHGSTVTLMHVGQEVTVVRFTLDERGRVVPGSVHDTPVGLRVRAQ